jgi:signal transduction histidine kinase
LSGWVSGGIYISAPRRVWPSLTTVLILFCCFAGETSASAQAADQATGSSLKHLDLKQLGIVEVTTVSKEPEQVWKAPAAIYVITQDDIRRSGARTLPDVLRLAPGVEVAQIDSDKWAIGIRGFQGRLSKSVLVLIDGRSVYTPLFAGVYWEVQDTLLSDIDRIEIIRGPGGTIWGANAVNGVINIITKNAKDTHGIRVSAGSGNVEQGFLSARYGGGGPDLSYRVYGKGFTRGPQFHFDDRQFDDWRAAQGGFRADWAASPSAALRGSPHIQNAGIYTADGQPFVFFRRARPSEAAPLLPIEPGQDQSHVFSAGELALARRIVLEGKPVGAVYIRSDLGVFHSRQRRYAEIVGVVLLVSLLAALLVSAVLRRAIANPLRHLAEITRVVSRDQNYSVRVPPTGSHDEVATLILGFNEMLEQIQQRDNALQQARETLEARVKERTNELQKAEEGLRALSRRLLQTQDDERQRIARELHDDVGQVVVALSMNLSLLQVRVAPSDSETAQMVTESLKMVEKILKDLRTMSYLLHPPLLEDTGLEPTLQWFVDGFTQRTHIPVFLDVDDQVGRLPRAIEVAIFRVVQECLTNIHRYSKTPDAIIRLTLGDGEVRLTVRDRGRGMPSESGFRPGVGIQGMRERVRQLGGTLEIGSAPEKGTTVTAVFPLAEGRPRASQGSAAR